MNRRLRPLAGVAVTAIIALLGACGSSAPTASGGDAVSAATQKGVKFSACMRSHGLPTFPDPGPSGKLTIDEVANGSSLDASGPSFKQALEACKSLEPAGFEGGTRSVQQQTAALDFAKCIRANGVPDFPDPTNGQPLVDTNRIPSAATSSGRSILRAAMQTCSALGEAAGAQR
jgi:hypothetical protein